MISDSEHRLVVALTETMHRRLVASCKARKLSKSQFIRDAVEARLAQYEAQSRAEEERAAAEREGRRRFPKLEGFRPLPPMHTEPEAAPVETHVAPTSAAEDCERLCREAAARIVAAGGSLIEMRVRAREAAHRVFMRHPLSGPREDEVALRLGALVREALDARRAPAKPVYVVPDDDAPLGPGEERIDVSRMTTYGLKP